MKNAITCHFSSVRQLPTPPASAASAIGIYFATMFASSLARTAARRAATATPMRLGALRAMSSETATFDLTGSFEVRHVRSHSKERCADCAERRRRKRMVAAVRSMECCPCVGMSDVKACCIISFALWFSLLSFSFGQNQHNTCYHLPLDWPSVVLIFSPIHVFLTFPFFTSTARLAPTRRYRLRLLWYLCFDDDRHRRTTSKPPPKTQ